MNWGIHPDVKPWRNLHSGISLRGGICYHFFLFSAAELTVHTLPWIILRFCFLFTNFLCYQDGFHDEYLSLAGVSRAPYGKGILSIRPAHGNGLKAYGDGLGNDPTVPVSRKA